MSFMKEEPRDPRAAYIAQSLYAKLREKKVLYTGASLRSMRSCVYELVKKHGLEEVEKALEWYGNHLGEEWVPHAYSGSSLRVKFDQIHQAMQRIAEEAPPEEISEEAKRLATWAMKNWSWPAAIEASLETVIQKSLENWRSFSQRIETLVRKPYMKAMLREVDFITRIQVMYSPTFLQQWLELLHEAYGWQSHYLGRMNKLVFQPGSVLFREHMWRGWAQVWTGSATAFDSLLKSLLISSGEKQT